MRFRRLTPDEFEEFKVPFVQFLATNGIDAPMWENIKRTARFGKFIITFEAGDHAVTFFCIVAVVLTHIVVQSRQRPPLHRRWGADKGVLL